MMRFQTVVSGGLATLLVVPAVLSQGEVQSLEGALAGTQRALEILRGLEGRLEADPSTTKSLILAATETPVLDEVERDRRLETLRGEVSLLQMELDARQSPVLAPDAEAAGVSAVSLAPRPAAPLTTPFPTTGLDDSMRERLAVHPPELFGTRPTSPSPSARAARRAETGEARGVPAYSADPLRHGIACYRAGRYEEARALLAPLETPASLYWHARTLERLELLEEAVAVMERVVAQGGDSFEARHAATDLEFLRWKRDFMQSLPGAKPKSVPLREGPR